jgi:hypothetical protein
VATTMMADKVKESIHVALEQLHDERERIERAITKLEGFLGNIVQSATDEVTARREAARKARAAHRIVPKQRSREGWTPQARQAAAERMRKYWAERREAEAQGKAPERKRRSSRASVAKSGDKRRKGWTPEAREAARQRMQKSWEARRRAAIGAESRR